MASCEWTRQYYLSQGLPHERVSLAYYGVDCQQYEVSSNGKLREELSLDPSVSIVGMVAYIYAPKWYLGHQRGIKGHEDLIDAAAICLQRGRKLHLVFVGGPWKDAIAYERKIRHYARQRLGKHVTFLGTRSDVAELYSEFQLVVHPSHSENLGGSIESLSSSTPTIATNVGGFPDLVRPEQTGWLVPPRCPGKLADAIGEALSDPVHAKQLAANGRERCRQLLDVRKTAEVVAECYQQILEKGEPPRELGHLSGSALSLQDVA
jgi:glycosyltransferase involved in cell wall biosynthesis